MKIKIDHTCMGLGMSPILFEAFLKQYLRHLAFFCIFNPSIKYYLLDP